MDIDIEELKKRVISNLVRYKLMDLTQMRPKMQNQLIEIEDAISESEEIRNQCIEQYKKSRITYKSLSDNPNVHLSRMSIDNNKDIIKVYIDFRIEEIDQNERDIFIQIKELKRKNLELENGLTDIVNGEFKYYTLLEKVKGLENKVNELNEENERNILLKIKLQLENNDLKKVINNNNLNILKSRK